MKITDAEKKALKGRGYIMTRDGEHFIARLITVDGVLTSEQFTVAAEAAEKFGNGQLAMTSRLTIEVQGLTYDTIEPFNEYISKAGLYTGGTGSRVRPIVACKGTVCIHGLIDTQGLARELHEKFYKGWYDVKLPTSSKSVWAAAPTTASSPPSTISALWARRCPPMILTTATAAPSAPWWTCAR